MTALTRLVLCAALVIAAAACDGTALALYLRTPQAPQPRWNEFAIVVDISAEVDVQQVVAQIAQELGMQPNSRESDSYWAPGDDERFTFSMRLEKNQDSVWIVRLLDWPTNVRSQLSLRAEREIRMRLELAGSDERVRKLGAESRPADRPGDIW
jgi:hypothetical protein